MIWYGVYAVTGTVNKKEADEAVAIKRYETNVLSSSWGIFEADDVFVIVFIFVLFDSILFYSITIDLTLR